MALLDLTIRRAPVALADDAGGGGPKNGDISLSNILKLIPGDVVAIYLATKGLTVAPILGVTWPTLLFAVCIITAIGLRWSAASTAAGGFNWQLLLVTAVAFFFWAHAVSETGPVIAELKGSAAGAVAALLGLFAPKFVPAEPGT